MGPSWSGPSWSGPSCGQEAGFLPAGSVYRMPAETVKGNARWAKRPAGPAGPNASRVSHEPSIRLRLGALLGIEVLPDVARPFDIAVGRVQLAAAELLQMGRLRVDEELVDRADLQLVQEAHVDPHPQPRKQHHRLFGGDHACVAQNAVGAVYLVGELVALLIEQRSPGAALVLDDLRNHGVGVAELRDDLPLAAPQRGLVADLIEVAIGLRALAVQAADRDADLLQAAEDLLDLAGHHQRRQVQHHADAHAGADVRGAGRQ